ATKHSIELLDTLARAFSCEQNITFYTDGASRPAYLPSDQTLTTTNMGFGWVKVSNKSPLYTFHGNTTFTSSSTKEE
ncbi:10953_t:CDS:1, partial [Rhizophagus irregularis]